MTRIANLKAVANKRLDLRALGSRYPEESGPMRGVRDAANTPPGVRPHLQPAKRLILSYTVDEGIWL